MESIRQAMDNPHPFIVENGAAVFLPKALFPSCPDQAHNGGEHWTFATIEPRAHWLALIEDVGKEFQNQFIGFSTAGAEGIAKMTGLSLAAASAANQRGYSEPLQWLGTESNKKRFIERLVNSGATVQQGGRFLSVSGACDKGRALEWLRTLYASEKLTKTAVTDIAIGDSQNDCAMLEVAKTALLIRSPVHDFPDLKRTSGIIRSDATGPAGWAQGVMQWLHEGKLLEEDSNH